MTVHFVGTHEWTCKTKNYMGSVLGLGFDMTPHNVELCTCIIVKIHTDAHTKFEQVYVKKTSISRNSNYLLVIVPTFVMPYSITLNPRMTPGCTTQRFA